MDKLLFKRFLFVVVSVLISSAVLGQQFEITGTVRDATDGTSLPGVNVLVKGTFTGISTDTNGKFAITVGTDDILVFSYVGYLTKEIKPVSGQVLNIALDLDVMAIAEVVTIGYGTIRKEDATGAVAAISTDDFNKGAITSPQELITGKIAGVQVTNGGGAPGEGVTIRIRGGSSLSATNDPLIVIDGVPVDNGGISGMRNPLNTIHPNDIETFTVLKDASATAIFGSRASNGVIIITTKKGKADKAVKVNYEGNISVGTRSGEIEVFTANEFRALINERYASNANATDLLGTANTDWQSEIFQIAISHDHNLSFSGGLYGVPYRASVGFSDQSGILKTDELQRITGSIALNPSFFDNHLKVNVNARGMNVNNNFANRGAVGAAVCFDPTQPVYDESGYDGYFTWLQTNGSGDPITIATANPVSLIDQRDDESTVNRIIGNVQFDYKFHFFPDLKVNLNLGLDRSESEGSVLVPETAGWSFDPVNGGGERTSYTQMKSNELLDFYFTYDKEIPSVMSRINATAGYSWQHFYNEGTSYRTNYNETNIITDSDYKSENYLVSFFGRLNYVLLDKYMFTATLRQDGSSRFSPDTRWGLFPAAAFAWDVAKEPFMGTTVLNTLKLRLGWGVTGQQDIGQNYPYIPRYTMGMENAMYQFGSDFYYTYRPEGYDANIKWEETTTYNIGLDFGFLNNRVTGTVDAYMRETNDLLNFVNVPAGTNLTNMIFTNVGDLINQGIEFTINGKVISTPDMVWELGFNATYNKNEITKLTLTDDPDYPGVATGGISGGVGNNIQIHSVGYPAYSFFVYEQVYDTDGNPIEGLYVDRNGDGQVNDEDKYRLHSASPDYFLGFSSYFSYKDFDFAFSGRASIGNYIYNNNFSGATYSSLYNSVGYLGNVPTSVQNSNFENPKYFSDYYIHNGSFMRLDNVSVGYNFSEMIPFVSNLRVYGAVQNVLVVTKYEGLDPEVGGGIDNNIYPRPRTFIFGVSVEF